MGLPALARHALVATVSLPLLLALAGCTGKEDADEKADDKDKAEREVVVKEEPKPEPKLPEPTPDPTPVKPKKKTKVSLEQFKVSVQDNYYGSKNLKIDARATINDEISQNGQIYAKVQCKEGEKIYSDVAWVMAGFGKRLDQLEQGESVDIQGTGFSMGGPDSMSHCAISFHMGGMGELGEELASLCYEDDKVSESACSPAFEPKSPQSGKPMVVDSLKLGPGNSYGSAGQLTGNLALTVDQTTKSGQSVILKAACDVDREGKVTRYADTAMVSISANPYEFKPGETLVRQVQVFWNQEFGLQAAPDNCDVTVEEWSPKDGGFSDYERSELYRGCYKAGALSEGRCEGSPPAAPDSKDPIEVSVSEVRMELADTYDKKGKQLKVALDVSVSGRAQMGHSLTGKAKCKEGREVRVENFYPYGAELRYLEPGETSLMTGYAFGSNAIEGDTGTCQIELLEQLPYNQRTYGSDDEAKSFGHWCIKGGKVRKRKCL